MTMGDRQRTFDGDELNPEHLRIARLMDEPLHRVDDEYVYRFNFVCDEYDLDPSDPDDRTAFDQALALQFAYPVEVPPDVAEMIEPLTEDDPWTHVWDARMIETVGGEEYFGAVPSEEAVENNRVYTEYVYIDRWGHVYDEDMFTYIDGDHYTQTDPDGPLWLYHESFHEYASTAVLVAPGGDRYKIEYDDGVFFDVGQYHHEYEYVRGSPFESVFHALVSGSGWHATDGWRGYVSTPEGLGDSEGAEGGEPFVRAKSGWHSSMERSRQSELINEITTGERAVPFPVLVVFGRTSNVMSVGLDLYVPADAADDLDRLFDGTTGAPGYGGVR